MKRNEINRESNQKPYNYLTSISTIELSFQDVIDNHFDTLQVSI